jgi:hypothetical protein
MPGANGPEVGALKVRQIGGPTSLDLPLQNVVTVDAVEWTTGGLSWAATVSEDGKSESIVLQHANPDGSVQTLYSELPQASPSASPAASPVGSPASNATPVPS